MKDVEFFEWLDHCSTPNRHWVSMEDVLGLSPVIVHTVGWVVKETDDYLIVVATMQQVDEGADASSQDVHCEMLIVKSCIKRREKLNLA